MHLTRCTCPARWVAPPWACSLAVDGYKGQRQDLFCWFDQSELRDLTINVLQGNLKSLGTHCLDQVSQQSVVKSASQTAAQHMPRTCARMPAALALACLLSSALLIDSFAVSSISSRTLLAPALSPVAYRRTPASIDRRYITFHINPRHRTFEHHVPSSCWPCRSPAWCVAGSRS